MNHSIRYDKIIVAFMLKISEKEGDSMEVGLIIIGIVLLIAVAAIFIFAGRHKQQVDTSYYQEQIRRGEERQKQLAEQERIKRMMQRERASRQ